MIGLLVECVGMRKLRATGGSTIATEHALHAQPGDSGRIEAERMQYFGGVFTQLRRGGDAVAVVR
jgi:hypothetical protein